MVMESSRSVVMEELQFHFRPEFLNRVNDLIIFKPLMENELSCIVELLCKNLRRRLADRNLHLQISENARLFIAQKG